MKIPRVMIALFFVGLTASAQEPGHQILRAQATKKLDESWPAVVANWEPVSIGAVDYNPYASSGLSSAVDKFGEPAVPLFGKVPLNSQTQKQLKRLLLSEAVPEDGVTTFCFFPRHAISFLKDGEKFTLVICFQCNKIVVLGAAPKGAWQHALSHFTNELRGYLNGQLDAGGVGRASMDETEKKYGAPNSPTTAKPEPSDDTKPKPE